MSWPSALTPGFGGLPTDEVWLSFFETGGVCGVHHGAKVVDRPGFMPARVEGTGFSLAHVRQLLTYAGVNMRDCPTAHVETMLQREPDRP